MCIRDRLITLSCFFVQCKKTFYTDYKAKMFYSVVKLSVRGLSLTEQVRSPGMFKMCNCHWWREGWQTRQTVSNTRSGRRKAKLAELGPAWGQINSCVLSTRRSVECRISLTEALMPWCTVQSRCDHWFYLYMWMFSLDGRTLHYWFLWLNRKHPCRTSLKALFGKLQFLCVVLADGKSIQCFDTGGWVAGRASGL